MEDTGIVVNGNLYARGKASGYQNNCLLDTLCQKLGLAANVAWVRNELQRLFPSGPSVVDAGNFLTLRDHWAAAIDLLFEADQSGKQKLRHNVFKVVCVDLHHEGNGEVVGTGDRKLIIAREHGNHFIPLHRRS